MKIEEIREKNYILPYLIERKLLKQYKKAKRYLLSGLSKPVNFKLKQLKENGIYSFRINKQFRALCVFKKKKLLVFKIDNHQ